MKKNKIKGTNKNDTLFGTDGDDHIQGKGGDDRILPGLGNDRIDGGRGFDTVVFDGLFPDYQIAVTNNKVDIIGPDGDSHEAMKVEALEFGDGYTVFLDGRNNRPYAQNDGGATDEKTVLSVSATSGVLTNDIDFDGDPLTVSAVDGDASDVGTWIGLSSGALLRLNADGGYDYFRPVELTTPFRRLSLWRGESELPQ